MHYQKNMRFMVLHYYQAYEINGRLMAGFKPRYTVIDDIGSGTGIKIPLWLFGFLY